jgi:hypothetical protein
MNIAMEQVNKVNINSIKETISHKSPEKLDISGPNTQKTTTDADHIFDITSSTPNAA